MDTIGTPVAYKLAKSETNVLSIESQSIGAGQAVMNEIVGTVDGGLSGSVGYVHTAAEVGKLYAGMAIQRKLAGLPGLPLTNGLNG